MEFQMRNKTFISSMVGVAAAAAVAGSANAAIVNTFDPFTTTQSIGTSSSSISIMSIAGSIFNQRSASRLNNAGGTGVNGTNNNVAFTLARGGGSASAVSLFYSMSGGDVKDLSSIAEMSIVLSALNLNVAGGTAATGVKFSWALSDFNGRSMYASETRSTNGTIIFNFASAVRDVGFDLTEVENLSLQVSQVGGSTSSNYSNTSSSGTLSNFSYTSVPAPGALVLLGVAGLAARRRRA
jgi:MYXO-CTERM domain-containing protein